MKMVRMTTHVPKMIIRIQKIFKEVLQVGKMRMKVLRQLFLREKLQLYVENRQNAKKSKKLKAQAEKFKIDNEQVMDLILHEFVNNVCRKYHVLKVMIHHEANRVIEKLRNEYVPEDSQDSELKFALPASILLPTKVSKKIQ